MDIEYEFDGELHILHLSDFGALDEYLYDLVADGVKKFSIVIVD